MNVRTIGRLVEPTAARNVCFVSRDEKIMAPGHPQMPCTKLATSASMPYMLRMKRMAPGVPAMLVYFVGLLPLGALCRFFKGGEQQ